MDNNTLTDAVTAAATVGAPPRQWHVGPDARIHLDGTGHPLNGATVTNWFED